MPHFSVPIRSNRKSLRMLPWLMFSRFLVTIHLADLSFAMDDRGGDAMDLSPYEVLLRLYDATRGTRWKNRTGWLVNENLCTWKGITCFQEDTNKIDFNIDDEKALHISEIDLSGNHLVGTLPFEIFTLPWLQSLILDDNPDLKVDLDDGLNGSKVQIMSFADTQVRTLDAISDAINLQSLHLERSQITGGFPEMITFLPRLTELYLDSNFLTGTIPTILGLMTQLEQLFLSNNRFEGGLPSELGLLTNLETLVLTDNALNGTIPQDLNSCISLKRLAVDCQKTNGGLTGTLPSLDQLPNMLDLSLRGNHLNGSIPSNFLAAAAVKDGLVRVDLSRNELTGAIPMGWSSFTRLRPHLQDNHISSFPEELCKVATQWSIQDGACPDTVLCPPGTYVAVTGRASAKYPCQPCDSAEFFGSTICLVVDNSGDGSNVTTPQTERDILELMFHRTGGVDWREVENWVQSEDVCMWYGIDCDEVGKVKSINLKHNGLTGVFPTEIFSLPSLERLDLKSNSVSFSFKGIGKATNLKFLDLSSSGIASLDFVEELSSTSLETLRLGSNNLKGEIPLALYMNLKQILELNLSNNQLSGLLGANTADWARLERLVAYGNQFQGPLPTELGRLTHLIILDLSENSFTGTLPTELDNLTALKSFSIHQTSAKTGLTGPLLSLGQLSQLTLLRLDGNNLSGILPPDFLVSTEKGDSRIEVRLSDNSIEGVVPSEWADRFDDLFIDLTGNKITGLHQNWCEKEDWMDGDVDEFDCDAILCPPRTYNPYGRQESPDSPCLDCPQGDSLMGVRECDSSGGSDEPTKLSVAVLKEFFYATGGPSWTNNTGWDDVSNHCSGWYGVACDIDGHVVTIDLTENGLSGTLSAAIFKLPELQELHLSGNYELACHFDSIESATHLETLELDHVGLKSTKGISKALNLMELHLSNNDLSGTFPSELLELVQLKYLSLESNKLTGRIPDDISRLSSLEELYLDNNKMTGQIPAAIGSLEELRILSLSDNLLSGTLPDELNDLWNLETLNLEREVVTDQLFPSENDSAERYGGGIRGSLLSLGNASRLSAIFLSGNSFTGPVPFDFLDGVIDKTQDIFVNLDDNDLSGTLPASLAQFSAMNLFAAGNKITGIAPGLCRQVRWMNGNVRKYGCDAILCPPGTFNDYGLFVADTQVEFPCEACDQADAALFYGSKLCLTSTEQVVSGEREALKEFFMATDGFHWNAATNWLDDSSSICSWFGVTCVDDNDEIVETLHLPDNGLRGSVPISFFRLKSLKEIDLSGNQVSINFKGADKVNGWSVLYLDYTGLGSLSGIVEASPELEILRIIGNDFLSFPDEVFELSMLEVLYMSENNFSTTFPDSLSQLSNLVDFDCTACGFKGSLPTSLGLMSNLKRLSLSKNDMTGLLPTELPSMSNLKLLDLSQQTWSGGNGFNGALPEFASIPGIVDISLAGNSFNGSIPEDFLAMVESDEFISVDLSNNQLTGTIPFNLSRFSYAKVIMSSNRITGIPPVICQKAWNGGSTGQSQCDHILCAKGSYSTLGYAKTNQPCLPCSDDGAIDFLGSTECGESSERKILIKLYTELNGDSWINNGGWLNTNVDVCKWFGIVCFSQGEYVGRVQEISLEDNDLEGTLSSIVYNLGHLVSLDVRRNNVRLSFHGIENATELKNLYLSETSMESLIGIGASKLKTLHLTSCKLGGSFPEEILNVKTLEGLYLNYNNFTGTLPSKIGQLTSLSELYLFQNKLSGPFPTEIGLLTNLVVLGVGGNQFTGTIPLELNQLSLLETISFQDNGVSGTEFGEETSGLKRSMSGSLPTFDGLVALREIYLAANSLQGAIPENFLAGVLETNGTLTVDLQNNELSGQIPTTLARFDDLRLYLAGNMISGIPGVVCEKFDWMDGLLKTGCDALLCEPGTYSSIGRRDSDHVCEPCAFEASTLNYGSRTCLPQEGEDLDERSVLFQIYHSLDGNHWINRDNWLEDNRSICSWHGVHCASEEVEDGDETVLRLELPSNGLQGKIPSSVYRLPSLRILNVRGNEVSLELYGAEAATTLEEIDLKATKQATLQGIGMVKSLRNLQLALNDFGGISLPDDLFDLTNLEILDVSESGFGGVLSDGIGKLTNLVELFCQANDFSGTLPSALGLLGKVEIADFSENRFGGNLPKEMANMTSLESLFIDAFSRNGAGISGPLLSFSTMPRLKGLYLGSNTLTGSIPDDFLAGIESTNEMVDIGLQGNRLTGVIPSELSRLKKLNIALSDNLIEGIESDLCAMNHWMDGYVKNFGCDAILCPPGTFNKDGRQTSRSDRCIPCHNNETQDYFGSTSCLEIQRKEERQILQLLFQATGGSQWKQNDGWMDESIDICSWHGVSCRYDSTVESILLGSNNLVGRTPPELFKLKNLRYLWLYSNPIDFSFEGIERAQKLTSLLLDSTGITSIRGIGRARSLSDIDVRFNLLTGTLPTEIDNLRELQSFSAGHNKFSGTIPTFSNLRQLKSLRLGDNQLSGTVPDFGEYRSLTSLDLSDNRLGGTVPGTLLQSIPADAKAFVDLSSNQITGTLPGELAHRHSQLTIYLRDNKIEGVDSDLCSAVTYNDGDVGDYGCDAILCPSGFFQEGTGRASRENGPCNPCPQAQYFGSSMCGVASSAVLAYRWPMAVGLVNVITFSIVDLLYRL